MRKTLCGVRRACIWTVMAALAGCTDAGMRMPASAEAENAVIAASRASLDQQAVVRAQTAAAQFTELLRATLQQKMQSDGAVAAVDVCHLAAPQIAAQVMREHGVRLGRVALPGRNRNARQAAAGWQLAALQKFQAAVAAGEPADQQVLVQHEGLPHEITLRMIRGIPTEPGCLACHGSAVAPAVRAAIARYYPDDAATGFKVGELRGALWVEVPTAAAGAPSDRHDSLDVQHAGESR